MTPASPTSVRVAARRRWPVTTVAAHAVGLDTDDSAAVHHAQVPLADVLDGIAWSVVDRAR